MSAIAYSSLRRSGMERSNEWSHCFTCRLPVYPRMEWAILPLLTFDEVM